MAQAAGSSNDPLPGVAGIDHDTIERAGPPEGPENEEADQEEDADLLHDNQSEDGSEEELVSPVVAEAQAVEQPTAAPRGRGAAQKAPAKKKVAATASADADGPAPAAASKYKLFDADKHIFTPTTRRVSTATLAGAAISTWSHCSWRSRSRPLWSTWRCFSSTWPCCGSQGCAQP